MKTIPTASAPTSSSASSTATAIPTSVTRPAASASRPTGTVDYRANVERQSREQKSVGSLLSYIVYGFIAVFVLCAALAGYGGYTLSKQIQSQSVTVADLDAHYAAVNKELNAKLASTQDTLGQAQAQIARQQDVILKQQDAINKLMTASTATASDLKKETASRASETTTLRARVRELDARISSQNTKY